MTIDMRSNAFPLKRALAAVGGVGCLATSGIIAAVFAFVALILFIVFGSFHSSPVYLQAMQAAQNDSRVTAALGTPLQSGWFITGEITEQGLSGDANLSIPISGPLKGATLYAAARKGNGTWQFYTLAVQVDGSSDIIVLEH